MYDPAVLLGAQLTDEARRFEERIRAAGFRADRVGTGPEVLERALFERYDAVIVDASIALLTPEHVRDLLRVNPRTQMLPVVLIDLDGRAVSGDYIRQPLKSLRWLESLLGLGSTEVAEGFVQADLREMSLPDLLQMLLQNRRTGIVEIDADGRFGIVEVAGDRFGRIQQDDAAKGLKALARLVGWSRGRVRFRPDESVLPGPDAPAAAILFDAVRLRDEADRLRGEIPAGSRLVVSPKRGGGRLADPLKEQILLLVDFYGAVDDILDRVEVPDAEILDAIVKLRNDGWIGVRTARSAEADHSDLGDITLAARLRDRAVPCVWVIGADADYARVLWSDRRLQKRAVTRRSLRNQGRFGGNGWTVAVGPHVHVWLRWLQPDAGLGDFIRRPGLVQGGAIFLLIERDSELLGPMSALAEELLNAGIPVVWLPIDPVLGVPDATTWIDAAKETLPGPMLPPHEDLAEGFWNALRAVLEHE